MLPREITMQVAPIILEDAYVKLLPMEHDHIKGLFKAGQHPKIWTWTTSPYCITQQNTTEWVETCLQNAEKGIQVPFVIIDKASNTIVGSTSYLNIMMEHKSIEIGYTFLTPKAQRSYINRRNKLLLLTHAFETLEMNRVALQTHDMNENSRNAIMGIGAKFEGVQRNCRIQHDNSIRSSAFFSIIKPEWSEAKASLKNKIEAASL